MDLQILPSRRVVVVALEDEQNDEGCRNLYSKVDGSSSDAMDTKVTLTGARQRNQIFLRADPKRIHEKCMEKNGIEAEL